jgi:transcriptional antiterminator NusG
MLMVNDALPIGAKDEALESLQRKIGGIVRGGKLYPLAAHMEAFTCKPIDVLTDPSWPEYVFQFDYLKIEFAKMGMRRRGFPVYFPQEPKSVKKNQFQRRVVLQPMLSPNFAFTSFGPGDRWKQLYDIPYVRRVISYGGRPVPVPVIHMERIRQREASLAIKARKTMPMPVEVGMSVQIEAGPFAGFFGRVIEIIEHAARIIIEVDLFGRQTPVEVSVNQVRAV